MFKGVRVMFGFFKRKKAKKVEVVEGSVDENKSEAVAPEKVELPKEDTVTSPTKKPEPSLAASSKEEKIIQAKTTEKPIKAEEKAVTAPSSDDKDQKDVSVTETDEEDGEADKKKYGRVYHISKRKSDGKWQVKFGGSDKVIKLFETQAEAIAFAKDLGARNEHGIVIHKTDGKIRKQKY